MEQEQGSGVQGRAPEPRYLAIGQIVGAHGIQGELKVKILTQDPSRFGLVDHVFVGREEEEPVARELVGYRPHKGMALLRLQGCDDRNAADLLRGCLIQIPRQDALPLEEGEYYEYQILGLSVYTETREHLGQVVEIIETGANDVFVVEASAGDETLIPVLEDVIVEIDLEAGQMVVDLPPGLR